MRRTFGGWLLLYCVFICPDPFVPAPSPLAFMQAVPKPPTDVSQGMDRIHLRALKEGDAKDLAIAADHEEVAKRLRVGFPSPYKIEHANNFIASTHGQAIFAIAAAEGGEGHRGDGTVIGIISLLSMKPADAEVYELGYWLTPSFWNQGIASRAISLLFQSAMLRELVEEGTLKSVFRVEALVAVSNLASSKALLKNSFRYEGRLRDHNRSSISPGLREDANLYARSFDLTTKTATRVYVQGNFVDCTDPSSLCDECNGEGERFAMEGYNGEGDGPEDYKIVQCLKCGGTGGAECERSSAPSSTRYRMNHVLELDKATGEILRIEPSSSSWASALVEDEATTWLWHSSSRGDFLTPGFVDTHVHAPQYSYTGTATDRPLMGSEGWLETYTFPEESRLRDAWLARQTYERVVRRLLREGTTTACYYATIHLVRVRVRVMVWG